MAVELLADPLDAALLADLPAVSLDSAAVEAFLSDLAARGRAPETCARYRRSLSRLAQMLPEPGRIRPGSLASCREALLRSGAAPRSVNVILSAANSFLAFCGRRDLQLADTLPAETAPRPELTRAEYRHLLHTAKLLGRERAYLLVLLFAGTDLPVSDLDRLTVEAARAGAVVTGSGKNAALVHLPPYCGRQGLSAGPVFLTRDGAPMSRTYVNTAIRELCLAARLPLEKGSPSALHRLYCESRRAVEANIALLVEQALDRQMEQEQLTLGWDA